MNTEILMQFLKLRLIDLQGSDEKLEKLATTSLALAKILEENPSKALSYTLIALDSKTPEDEPILQEAISVLEKNWTTYFNTFSSTPVQVIRALLLQALVITAKENQQVAIAFVSLVRNILPHMGIGNEADMWANLVTIFESELNIRAQEEWTTPEKISVDTFLYNPPKQIKVSSSDVVLDRVTLEDNISKAAGPQNKAGKATGGNTSWPHNDPTNWAFQFTSLMTSAIADTVDNAFTEAKIKPIDLSKPLQELSVAVSDHINSTLIAVSKATIGLQRRTSLIWWKESLYSQSASFSYRKMPIHIAAAIMAFDLFNQVPIYSPASVSAFLAESILSIIPSQEENIAIGQSIIDLKQSKYAESLCIYIQNLFKDFKGRGPLLMFLISEFNPNDEQFLELTGIEPDTQLTISEWASWLFRELQAIRAVTSGEIEDE